ncbi:IS110 family transposase [Nitrospirillum amazonense]|uniref:IS110 family transposase n=1 Tax=Nitrospirillum amazonense TaxID=28077 RepID=UPI002DD44EEB|nr:IS110 family transposase [Nitrospirillum amazonense]MEC4592299.1 IS110 family transposase [Nitrospirillum amazonense]
MTTTYLVAIDLAKRHFQVCATDFSGKVLFNRAFSRQKLMVFLSGQPRCIVAMEACSTSHSWGRLAEGAGHEVRLIPPIYVKPFVKRQKNDAADAEAISEAARRPNLHFVAVKSAEHQARAVTFRTHQCFVRQRTQLINALRGHLAEFGIVAPVGATNVTRLEEAIGAEGDDLPPVVHEMAGFYIEQIKALTVRIDGLVQRLQSAYRTDAFLRRLCTLPGVGPVTAGAHAVLILDQAGWHHSAELIVPVNITLMSLPPRCPELNPVENLWQFMRGNWLSNRIFQNYDDIVDHCCRAWNKLVEQPYRIMSIGLRQWAHGS